MDCTVRARPRLPPQRRGCARSRTLRQAIAGIESVRTALGTASLKAEFLANKRDVYDAAIDILLQSAAATPVQLFDLIERARSRNLQDALRDRMSLPTLPEVQRRLDPHSLLIEYWIAPNRVAALWIGPGASGVVTRTLTLADTTAIRQLAAALPTARDTAWRGQASQIGQLLLAGIPTELSVTQLLIVPDGVLHLLPFEALSPGADPLLIEQFAVSYLPSAALLHESTREPAPVFPWSRQLLAFGDPVAPAGGVFPDDRLWTRLPDAARELHAIAAVLPGRCEVHSGAGDFKALLTKAAGVPLLHFSTHATVDPTDPNRSRMLFTPERGSPGSEYLFWPEAAALPLSGVDLVTLSACDTEGGKMVRGEGVQSFSRAFLAGRRPLYRDHAVARGRRPHRRFHAALLRCTSRGAKPRPRRSVPPSSASCAPATNSRSPNTGRPSCSTAMDASPYRASSPGGGSPPLPF